jgi:hypothetical protein
MVRQAAATHHYPPGFSDGVFHTSGLGCGHQQPAEKKKQEKKNG